MHECAQQNWNTCMCIYKKSTTVKYLQHYTEYTCSLFFSSESPTQAFLVTTLWLYRKFIGMKESHTDDDIEEALSSICLAYDNMCHMDGLRMASLDLPLCKPFDKAWKQITKVIDRLHLRNHVDSRCKEMYDPEKKFLQALTQWHVNKLLYGPVGSKR